MQKFDVVLTLLFLSVPSFPTIEKSIITLSFSLFRSRPKL
uniref:Uncharacterized protein n=1 Tax=Manihot esculenta TaxID=3983 RepID=A0A199UAQ0_MANES